MIRLRRDDQPPEQLDGEVVSAFYFTDIRSPLAAARLDEMNGGSLAAALAAGELHGKAGEHMMVPGCKVIAADRVLYIGGGSWSGLCVDTYRQLVVHLLQTAFRSGCKQVALCLTPLPEQIPVRVELMVSEALRQLLDYDGECSLSVITG